MFKKIDAQTASHHTSIFLPICHPSVINPSIIPPRIIIYPSFHPFIHPSIQLISISLLTPIHYSLMSLIYILNLYFYSSFYTSINISFYILHLFYGCREAEFQFSLCMSCTYWSIDNKVNFELGTPINVHTHPLISLSIHLSIIHSPLIDQGLIQPPIKLHIHPCIYNLFIHSPFIYLNSIISHLHTSSFINHLSIYLSINSIIHSPMYPSFIQECMCSFIIICLQITCLFIHLSFIHPSTN